MSKGETTRAMIVAQAAALFNRQGYAAASMSDIMQATGLQKGGIYNHFKSKAELTEAAFDYAFGLLSERMQALLRERRHAGERLLAVVDFFDGYGDEPPLVGGCILMNTAIESDFADADDDERKLLRRKVRDAMNSWLEMIKHITCRGVERGQLRPEADGVLLGTLLIATLEGALMLSQLYRDYNHLHRAADYLRSHICSLVLTDDTAPNPT